jgi:DNA polymerase V
MAALMAATLAFAASLAAAAPAFAVARAALFDCIIDRELLVRRIYLTAARVEDEASAPDKKAFEQLDLFTDYSAVQKQQAQEAAELEREKKVQRTILDIKKRFGKNAILKGMNLEEGATARDRNNTIGGHRSG